MPHVRELKLPPGCVLTSPAHGEWYWSCAGLRNGPFKSSAAAWNNAWLAHGRRWKGSHRTLARMGANRGRSTGGRPDAEYERTARHFLQEKYPELRGQLGRSGRGGGSMKHYTLTELRARPTLVTGQDADLKVETTTTRVWLSRMTRADGARCDHEVTVERKVKGRWQLAGHYCPAVGGGRARRRVRADLALLRLLPKGR